MKCLCKSCTADYIWSKHKTPAQVNACWDNIRSMDEEEDERQLHRSWVGL